MRVAAAILAAGSSSRLGLDKTLAQLGDRPVWQWSFDTYRNHPLVSEVVIVASETNQEEVRRVAHHVVLGGATRQASVQAALNATPDAEILLLHDAARPFVDAQTISLVLSGIESHGAAAAAAPVTDTIKQVDGESVKTLDRSKLVAMQTPQGGRRDLLLRAHKNASEVATDDLALMEAIGVHPKIVMNTSENFKITTMDDLARARDKAFQNETRVGFGYDVHAFSDDPSRLLMLGGIAFENHPALDGHSDADVLLHAAVDALLGAAGMGDIGVHFPNTDLEWKDAPSLHFLRHTSSLLKSAGWAIGNLDLTLVAESPKVMAHAAAIVATIAMALEIEEARVNLKATTNEKLGFLGRSEGIAAFATASIRK